MGFSESLKAEPITALCCWRTKTGTGGTALTATGLAIQNLPIARSWTPLLASPLVNF